VTASTIRVQQRRMILGAALAASLLVGTAGCGASATGEDVTALAPPPPTAGHPPGTVTLPLGNDMAAAVKKVQDAITAGGGAVLVTVDNAVDAGVTGATVPGNTVVIGGAPAVGLPMLRANQQAAAALPARYLVRQEGSGVVSLVYNGPDYVAAVAGVVDLAATNPFATATSSVADKATGAPGVHQSAPLIGVTPKGFLRVAAGDAPVPVTVTRLTTAIADGETVVTNQDLAAGSAEGGPALRATQSLLVSAPTFTSPLVAAAPTFGLELPLRFVVWLDDKNTTEIGYVDVGVLAARHGLKADDPNVVKLAAECDRIAKIAAGA
jgi:uncharacterized protein (DUF302 family)